MKKPSVISAANGPSEGKSGPVIARIGPAPAPCSPEPLMQSALPTPKSKRIGTRTKSIEKIGRRKRRIFFVAPEDLERDDAWLAEPGWYVDTVRPPAAWISNDPFGPYLTLQALRQDAELAYRDEEDQ